MEFALPRHLLRGALLIAVREHVDEDLMISMVPRLVRGWCGLTAQRLAAAFALEPTVEGVGALLSLHPMMHPLIYPGFHVEGDRISFAPTVAKLDDDGAPWVGMPALPSVLQSIVQAGFPSARISEDLVITVGHEPVRNAPEVSIARISTGAAFRFSPRRPVRV